MSSTPVVYYSAVRTEVFVRFSCSKTHREQSDRRNNCHYYFVHCIVFLIIYIIFCSINPVSQWKSVNIAQLYLYLFLFCDNCERKKIEVIAIETNPCKIQFLYNYLRQQFEWIRTKDKSFIKSAWFRLSNTTDIGLNSVVICKCQVTVKRKVDNKN